ncbi:MAG: hypothetical protein KC443_25095 [Anaerolineales bacterium]|nr:hypothetical protein [Anaerolineales bacterium]
MLHLPVHKPRCLFHCLLIIWLFLVSCTSTTEPVETEPTAFFSTSTPPMPVSTIAVIPTATSITSPVPLTPSRVVTPTITPTVFPTATTIAIVAAATAIPVATLSVEQQGVLLSELMASNSGCELPCWWGVTPGEANVQEAEDKFVLQGVKWREGEVIMGYPRPDSSFYYPDVSVMFFAQDGIVQLVSVDGTRDHYDLAYRFTEDWAQYSLAAMLNHYGVPSQVLLSAPVFVEADVPNEYDLFLYFPSSSIEIKYLIAAEALENGKSRLCSDFEDVQNIYMNLYAVGKLTDEEATEVNSLEGFVTWEFATGMDTEEFYNLFKDTSSPVCVEVD